MTTNTKYFEKFRKNIIGNDHSFISPFGEMPILYADWIASGRLYQPIENFISQKLGPYVANTHTETTATGQLMTDAYHQAQINLKKHVNANADDVLISAGFGMTAVVNKFQRILGLRLHEKYKAKHSNTDKNNRPIVFITHMEHHSNQTSWLECECDVEVINPDSNGLPDQDHLENLLNKYANHRLKIGAFSACSNVTGIITPIHELAELMHKFDGLCFADYAASAPYVNIDMHPENEAACLDAVMFSPHKFLGGPGASGILVFSKNLYNCKIPDHPGGGTVLWTNPWGEHKYFENIEIREDGGTPGFLQTIRASLACQLKDEMDSKKIIEKEHNLSNLLHKQLKKIPTLHILEEQNLNRIAVFSVYAENKHYNLIVKMLNDLYGIQTRGGFSCAGTYGHLLFNIDQESSKTITNKIEAGDFSDKSGWVRISLHPTMNEKDVNYIAECLAKIVESEYDKHLNDYLYNPVNNEFTHKKSKAMRISITNDFKAF